MFVCVFEGVQYVYTVRLNAYADVCKCAHFNVDPPPPHTHPRPHVLHRGQRRYLRLQQLQQRQWFVQLQQGLLRWLRLTQQGLISEQQLRRKKRLQQKKTLQKKPPQKLLKALLDLKALVLLLFRRRISVVDPTFISLVRARGLHLAQSGEILVPRSQ